MTKMLQKFSWHATNGRMITIEEWVSTLTQSEQQQYWSSRARQDQLRQQAIDSGLMIPTTEGYEWRDAQAAQQGKPSDAVWDGFFKRWLKECDIQFSTSLEESQ